jgi:hypothetical protein
MLWAPRVLADMKAADKLRSLAHGGLDLLSLSSSPFDPKRRSSAKTPDSLCAVVSRRPYQYHHAGTTTSWLP